MKQKAIILAFYSICEKLLKIKKDISFV